MSITKDELYKLYIVEKENNKQTAVKEHVQKIKEEVLMQNSLGRTSYSTSFWNQEQEYLNAIIAEITKIFVDSRISIKDTVNNNRITITTLKIVWEI
jgi:protoporphyrinogen oxidase